MSLAELAASVAGKAAEGGGLAALAASKPVGLAGGGLAALASTRAVGQEEDPNKGILGYEEAPSGIPLANYAQTVRNAWSRHEDELVKAGDDFRKGDLLHYGLAALDVVGGTLGMALSPLEGGIASVAAPIEKATGVKGLAAATGDIGTNLVTLGSAPWKTLGKVGSVLTRPGSIAKAVQGGLAPATLTKATQATAAVMGQFGALVARSKAITEKALEESRRVLMRLPYSERLDFIFTHEGPTPRLAGSAPLWRLTPELQKVSEKLSRISDRDVARIRSLKGDRMQAAIFHYFPHYFKDTEKSRSILDSDEFKGWFNSRIPLQGSRDFMHQRSIETIKEGVTKWGLELASEDPIELAVRKHVEMMRFYYAERTKDTLRKLGLITHYSSYAEVPRGMVPILDPLFRTSRPAKLDVGFNFDQTFRNTIKQAGGKLGINIEYDVAKERIMKFPGAGEGTVGLFDPNTMTAYQRVMSPDFIMSHEFGHALDQKYGIRHVLQFDPRIKGELKILADERLASLKTGQFTPARQAWVTNYIHNDYELIANFLHGVWYVPEETKKIAPIAWKFWHDFVDARPDLKDAIKGIRPGFEVGTNKARFYAHDQRIQNPGWYAPKEVANVIENYMSKGLQGNSLYQAARRAGNMMTMLQLSTSGFHFIFTVNEAMFSKLALSINEFAHKRYGSALKELIGVPAAPLTTIWRGHKVGKAYQLDDRLITDPVLKRVVNAEVAGGGRYKYDVIYGAHPMGSFVSSIRNGTFFSELRQMTKGRPIGGAIDIFTRAVETSAAPLMEAWVPRLKQGAFYDAAKAWLHANPMADDNQLRLAMHKIWESIDNRFGQMVYDNLFWKKTVKDLAFLLIRSVGWNLGTVREVGGGLVDMTTWGAKGLGNILHKTSGGKLGKRAEMEWTMRMSYTLSMSFWGAVQGAFFNYLLTSEGPKEVLDYYFPRTGRLLPSGKPERFNIPAYIKDVVEVNYQPGQTVLNKLNPLVTTAYQAWQNRDYYGAAIHNAQDPMMTQLKDWAAFIGAQNLPFSIRNLERKSNRIGNMPLSEKLLGFAGIQPAPSYITEPERQAMFQRLKDRTALRKLLKERGERIWPFQ